MTIPDAAFADKKARRFVKLLRPLEIAEGRVEYLFSRMEYYRHRQASTTVAGKGDALNRVQVENVSFGPLPHQGGGLGWRELLRLNANRSKGAFNVS